MIIDKKRLVRNRNIYLISEFLWNFGRTFPHAVLTILLLKLGLSLSQIAILQIVYMIVVVFGEFPSGVISDYFSRKKMYIGSLILLGIAYLLIFFSKGNFGILIFAWAIYGLSNAMKSGTLDNEIVLEYREVNKDISHIVNAESYILSISSIIGAFLGSILYQYIDNYIYSISIILLFISIFIAYFYKPQLTQNNPPIKRERVSFIGEFILGIKIFHSEKKLKLIIIMISITAFFTQMLFQYWQILYEAKSISSSFFGYVYILLQISNIIGTFIYKRISHSVKMNIYVLVSIPIFSFGIIYYTESLSFFLLFPFIVSGFYIYNQYLMVLMKENGPKEYMSTFTSLVSTCNNICSITSLLMISCLLLSISVIIVYIIMFVIFSVLSLFCLVYLKHIKIV